MSDLREVVDGLETELQARGISARRADLEGFVRAGWPSEASVEEWADAWQDGVAHATPAPTPAARASHGRGGRCAAAGGKA